MDMNKLLGIDLILKERQEQIHKHGISRVNDVTGNWNGQLCDAAVKILSENRLSCRPPVNWPVDKWNKMVAKSYQERLVIAGALIAAEIDRINFKFEV